jgi:hypothetical protein
LREGRRYLTDESYPNLLHSVSVHGFSPSCLQVSVKDERSYYQRFWLAKTSMAATVWQRSDNTEMGKLDEPAHKTRRVSMKRMVIATLLVVFAIFVVSFGNPAYAAPHQQATPLAVGGGCTTGSNFNGMRVRVCVSYGAPYVNGSSYLTVPSGTATNFCSIITALDDDQGNVLDWNSAGCTVGYHQTADLSSFQVSGNYRTCATITYYSNRQQTCSPWQSL